MKKPPAKAIASKSPRASQVTMTELVLPSDTNALGTIFGGKVMSWIDIAAAIAAQRHAEGVCVTASIDALSFLAPVRLGDVVTIKASVNDVGRSSMEIGVKVETEDPKSGTTRHTSSAYLTFVALDAYGKPRAVPPLAAENATDRRRMADAKLRRESRMRLKEELGG